MVHFFINILISATLISFCSWLSQRKTDLAGFILALPISTLLALALTQGQYQNSEKSILFAKSIFLAIPVSLLFFVPFLLSKKFQFSFWMCYGSGVGLIGLGYFIHKWIFRLLLA